MVRIFERMSDKKTNNEYGMMMKKRIYTVNEITYSIDECIV